MTKLGQWRLAVKILPLILLVILAKSLLHAFGLEVLSLSPLFSGVVGATVFLLGFMIAGTLTDYKESERLPSDLAASLHSITDECQIAVKGKGKTAAAACMKNLDQLTVSILDWLRNKATSDKIFTSIEQLNDRFVDLEPYVQATFINRLKTEQNQIRRMVLRIQTIRETSFVGTGYAIAKISTFLLIGSLVFTENQHFMESLFILSFISFVLIYMIALITDLDNPFDYSSETEGNEVSLKPLGQLRRRLKAFKNY